ncbi:uncharacterized protein LOC118438134 [Folsomia candida]|uniref:uncharacterized protein LOC118438134 n=1 Tax=Folsomia candida TaxID=158441 RepID=UPI00160556D6|nr:uncharacterized protein LOC118438134 [Folsomia candida]
MENPAQTCHLISDLPETISKIMGFLSTPDLESASLVNSTWEEAALKHVLVRNPVEIHLHNVTEPEELVPLATLSPPNVKILIHDLNYWTGPNVEILAQKIDLFSSLNFSSVTKLSLVLPLDASSHHVASRMVKLFEKSSTNLRSLEFQLLLINHEDGLSSGEHLFPDSVIPHGKKLVNLALHLETVQDRTMNRWPAVISLIIRILKIFCKVGNLSLSNLPGGLLSEDSVTLPRLKSISLERNINVTHLQKSYAAQFFKFETPLKPNFATIIRLEFNVCNKDVVELFRLLAPQLEHVCISGVRNVTPDITPSIFPVEHINVPILPKLKVFEILRQEIVISCTDNRAKWFRPDLYLNFETGSDYVKLSYDIQFPILEKLVVRVVPQNMFLPFELLNIMKKPCENLQFEATMLFLYETFLAEDLEPCGTLRNLDISIPMRVGVGRRMKMRRRCGCDDEVEICKCWGWKENGTDFYSRIATIFPNVDYGVLERGRRSVRMAKLIELGVTFGGEGGICGDCGDKLGLY